MHYICTIEAHFAQRSNREILGHHLKELSSRPASADTRNQVRAWVLCDAPGASRDVRSCGRLPEPGIVKPLAKLHRSDGAGVVVGRINEDDGIFRCDRRRYL